MAHSHHSVLATIPFLRLGLIVLQPLQFLLVALNHLSIGKVYGETLLSEAGLRKYTKAFHWCRIGMTQSVVEVVPPELVLLFNY